MATGYELFIQQGGASQADVDAWEAANPGKSYTQSDGPLTYAEWSRNAMLGAPTNASDPASIQNTRGNTVNWSTGSNGQIIETPQPWNPVNYTAPSTTTPNTTTPSTTTPTTVTPPANTAGGTGNTTTPTTTASSSTGQTIATPTSGTDWAPGQNYDPAQVTHGSLGGAVSYGTINRGVAAGNRNYTNLTDPRVPAAGIVQPAFLQASEDQVADPTDSRFQMMGNAAIGSAGTASSGTQVDQMTAAQISASTVGQGAAGIESAAVQSEMDPGTAAEAALGALPPEAMVQSQMEELTAGLESGDIPLWARPAVDAVEASLASRGLSRSSVGQAALSNAIIQAALPMAQQNATAVTQNFSQDKSNQQQVNLQNAQASQQFQTLSLSNEQQMSIQNANMRQQAMLSDQAALNATKQFNATSENQTQQFMTNLKASIDAQNKQRMDAMEQFNAGQDNAIAQFNANLAFNTEKFNAENATLISQSNLNWRRNMNTINTATQNQANQINAQNAFGLSNKALDNMWQEMRDTASWAYEASESNKQLASALAIATMKATSDAAIASDASDSAAWVSLGQAIYGLGKDTNWFGISS